MARILGPDFVALSATVSHVQVARKDRLEQMTGMQLVGFVGDDQRPVSRCWFT